MDASLWEQVDTYYETKVVCSDPSLEQILTRSRQAGLPEIQVSCVQGQFLSLLVRIQGAQRILEVGSLGGYSAAWLAKGMVSGGTLISLERDPETARVARENLKLINWPANVTIEIRTGDAVPMMEAMHQDETRPFDLIFLDADKSQYPNYLDACLPLCRPGSVILADNVVRGGKVLQEESEDDRVQGVRELNRRIQEDPRLIATTLQTVGKKGYDGFTLIVVDS